MKTSVIAYVYAIVAAAAASLVGLYLFDSNVSPALLIGPALMTLVAIGGALYSYQIKSNTAGKCRLSPT